MDILTYAKAGGPPENWHGIVILDRDTGEFVRNAIEVDAAEGWLIRYQTDDSGAYLFDAAHQELLTERIEGRFALIPDPRNPAP